MVLYIRSPSTASRVFGLDSPGEIFRSVPRVKFMFKAEFFLNPLAKTMIPDINLNSSSDISAIAFKVKQIDKPRITLSAQELNNYNKKRIVYTKIDYADASLRIFDTVDNSVWSFWVNYFTYYFGDSRIKSSTAQSMRPTDAEFVDDTGWGLRPLTEETNFFNKISVSAYFAGTVTKFSYINPKITAIDWGQNDYSSSDMLEANVTFKYEYLQYEDFGKPINEDTGFWATDALNVETTPTTSLFSVQPRMFNEQTQQNYQPGSALGSNQTSSATATSVPSSPTSLNSVPGAVGRNLQFNG